MMMTAVIITSCRPEEEPNNNGNNNVGGADENVTVITTTPQDITSTGAVCGGAVTFSDGITLSEVGVCWGTGSTPTVAGYHLSAGSVEEQFTCMLSGLDPDTKYYVRAYALCGEKYYYGNVKDFTTAENGGSGGGNGTYNGHDYVDLGLPSGTLWAICNIGATTPEGYGDFFAWGEITMKTINNWNTYKYYENGKLTKYCFDSNYGYIDYLTILEPCDDAATVKWGNGWSIPTKEQWQELIDNTDNSWTIQNNVTGRLFIGNNGSTLFLPAAGLWYESAYGNNIGLYWSNTLSYDNPSMAWSCFFLSSGTFKMNTSARDIGVPIRPVYSMDNNSGGSDEVTLFAESFNNGQGQFTIHNVTEIPDELSEIWCHNPSYSCMYASGYSDTLAQSYDVESWLVSPFIDLLGSHLVTLRFDQAVKFDQYPQERLHVMVSTNYDGDVVHATWTELNLDQWPPGNNWVFITSTANLSSFSNQRIVVAFKYTSTTTVSPAWELKNVLIKSR